MQPATRSQGNLQKVAAREHHGEMGVVGCVTCIVMVNGKCPSIIVNAFDGWFKFVPNGWMWTTMSPGHQ
jgi:hypothetical protein